MTFKLPLAAVFAATLALTACGGGGGSSTPTATVYSPATLTMTDTTTGTGATAAAGSTVTVHYSGYLYVETGDHKGTKFDSSVGKTPFVFKLAAGSVISGFDTGVTGMKVGGKRTVLIPYSLGYGSAGSPPAIPGGSGLVFDLELIAVN